MSCFRLNWYWKVDQDQYKMEMLVSLFPQNQMVNWLMATILHQWLQLQQAEVEEVRAEVEEEGGEEHSHQPEGEAVEGVVGQEELQAPK